jgi:hypothetical protein
LAAQEKSVEFVEGHALFLVKSILSEATLASNRVSHVRWSFFSFARS